MGVTIRKKQEKWYQFINHNGQRKAKCIGENRAAAVQVRRAVEARLALGEMGIPGDQDPAMPLFGEYADGWLRDHAALACKPSTIDGYESALKKCLRPHFGMKRLNKIRHNDDKGLINAFTAKVLARATIRNAISILRGIFNHAIDEELLEFNSAASLGRFTRNAKTSEVKGIALTFEEVDQFLSTAKRVWPAFASPDPPRPNLSIDVQ